MQTIKTRKYLVIWRNKSGPFEGEESGCIVEAETRGEAVCKMRDAHPYAGDLVRVEAV